jgi:hypothetical protein
MLIYGSCIDVQQAYAHAGIVRMVHGTKFLYLKTTNMPTAQVMRTL